MKHTSQKDLITVLFDALTGSSALVDLVPDGSLRVYDTEAPPEPQFPYLVHRLVLGGGSLEDVASKGRYFISVYTLEVATTLINNFVREVVDLLNNQIFKSATVGYVNLSLVEGGGRVDTDNDNVKRYDLPFDLTYSL